MSKRNLAAILWFFAGWAGGSLYVGISDLPSLGALLPAIFAGGLVRWDPFHVLWTRRPADRRRVRPIDEVAGELDRQAQRQAQGEAGPVSQ
jgi:hypothetical protein